MSRPGRFASSTALLLAALVIHAPANYVAAASGWQPSGQRGSNRAGTEGSRASAALPPSANSLKSVQREPTWSRPNASSPSIASTNSPSAQQNATRWVLPSQRPTTTAANSAQRPKQTAAARKSTQPANSPQSVSNPAHEPQPFSAPANAQDIAAASQPKAETQARRAATTATRTGNASAASVSPASAATFGNKVSTKAGAAPREHRASRNARPPRSTRPSYASRLRKAVSTTFEGPETWAAFQDAEDLPLPGQVGESLRDSRPADSPSPPHMIHEGYEMMGPEFGPGYGEYGDGMCHGPGCGDGCYEPGCECEPSCGCGGQDDLFCVGWGDNDSCHTVRLRVPKWQELMFFGGVHGFKGPYDRSRDSGNFGFHEGLNAGFKVPFSSLGYQVGYQMVHSQLHGDKDTDIADPHTQHFLTAGLFHRVQDGFQGGIAWDMLRDERWGSVDFHQLRTELSFVDHGCHEFGFAGTFHLNEHERGLNDEEEEDEDELESMIWQASDQYLLFYRFHGRRGGEGRFYAGFNDNDDGILGSDMILPVNDRWSVQTGFTYLIPDDEAGDDGAANEAWNIRLGLVWHWGCRARTSHSSCYRPLFNVADNGTLIVDGRPGESNDNGSEED